MILSPSARRMRLPINNACWKERKMGRRAVEVAESGRKKKRSRQAKHAENPPGIIYLRPHRAPTGKEKGEEGK